MKRLEGHGGHMDSYGVVHPSTLHTNVSQCAKKRECGI